MTKRSITSEEIKKLATISKLSTLDDEMDRFSNQSTRILDYSFQFDNIDISHIKSLLNALDQANDSNPDEPQPSITQKLGSKNEPIINGNFFQVREVFKKNV